MINLMMVGIYWEKNADKTQGSSDFYKCLHAVRWQNVLNRGRSP